MRLVTQLLSVSISSRLNRNKGKLNYIVGKLMNKKEIILEQRKQLENKIKICLTKQNKIIEK